ncbi:MAG: questin oxidase family protein [Pseudomonadota bacterium]
MPDTNTEATLRQLLDANSYFALNGKGTTNHCPMALCALAGMGATVQQLKTFFDQWKHRYALAAPPLGRTIEAGNWRVCVGDASAFGACRAYFAGAIGNAGADAVLIDVLSELPFAPASQAFHAVIRLAYGLDAQHSGEIAAGLAALVCTNLPIETSDAEIAPAASVREGLASLAHAFGGVSFEGPSITARLRAATCDSSLTGRFPPLPAGPQVLDDMARVAIAAYMQTNDFTALHIVTGLHAVRRVLRRLPKAMAIERLPNVWAAVCASYLVIGAPALSWPETSVQLVPFDGDGHAPWRELLALAVADSDDHVIKMVYTCWREHQRDPSPLYRLAAERLVRRECA